MPKLILSRRFLWRICAIGLLSQVYSSADEPAAPLPPPLTHYLGREIAPAMSFQGAPWLIRAEREKEERCSLMITNLGVKPGMTVCDMGCGNGFYALQLAKLVGPTGKVLCVDIQPEMLDLLRERAAREQVANIEPILGTLVDPKLPEGTVDLILCVDVYHEFSHPEQMLQAMRRSLSPEGVVVLVEFRLEDPKVPIKLLHKMSKAQIHRELEGNGYKLVREFDRLPWQHMMAFGRDDRRGDQPPNVLFLLADDQRPDTIGALGNRWVRTPNLDELSRRSTVFRRAVCSNPLCTPSRAEILSGCQSWQNGVSDFGGKWQPDLVLWPQAMQAAGYRTWYVGKWHNDGLPTTRGFDATRGLFMGGGGQWWRDTVDYRGQPVTGYRGWVFRDDQGRLFPERGLGLTPDISRRFADAAIEIIQASRGQQQPFFLQVCFTAPHDPLLTPPEFADLYAAELPPLPENFLERHPFDHGNFDGRDEQLLPWPRTPDIVRRDLAMYYRVIAHLDAQLGRVLASLREAGMAENTLVIFASDHGLAVGSHGLRGKQNMYEHTVNVPLLISGPGVPAGTQCDAQVYLRELFPTVCELVGLPIPASVRGRSFAAVVRGEADRHHEQVFCHFRDSQRMVRDDRWKLIEYPQAGRRQLFDLQADSFERHDLSESPEHAARLAALQQQLASLRREFGDPLLAAGDTIRGRK